MKSATRFASALATAFQSLTSPISRVGRHNLCIGTHVPWCIPLLSHIAPSDVAAERNCLWASRFHSSAAHAESRSAECTGDTIARNDSHDTVKGSKSQQFRSDTLGSPNSAVDAEHKLSLTTDISSSDRRSDAPQSQQQQQHATEQLLSELFDAELERRLKTAAVAVRQQASSNDTSSITAPDVPQQRSMQQIISQTLVSAAAQTDLAKQQQQQQRFQPGVLPSAPPAYQPPHSSSSSSSRPSHVSSWHPASRSAAAAADPWAPIPGPGLARSQLSARLLHLLQQAGVPQHTATTAIAAAAATVPDPQSSGTNTTATQQQQQQQQQHRSSSGHPSKQLLNRLPAQQLVHLLDNCQAPTYGSKDLLINRVLLLLQEQAMQQQRQSVQQQQQVVSRLDHQRSLLPVGELYSDQPGAQSQDHSARLLDHQSSNKLQSKQQQLEDQQLHQSQQQQQSDQLQQQLDQPQQQQQLDQPQQQQRHASRHQQVAAAAAARQQLLDLVVDVREIGGWLMAARAQDVCVINVRDQAGLCEQIVIGTGLSQRHTHACAEAVAWQIKEKAKRLVHQSHHHQQQRQQQQEVQIPGNQITEDRRISQQQQQQQMVKMQSSLNDLLPALRVLGDSSSDWALLDTGKVAVHVLTERARRFYNLEGLWGGTQGRSIEWMMQEGGVETKETIGRDMHA